MPEPSEHPSAQVLIVDDEVAHAQVMAEALQRLGHVCTLVHSREAALDEMRHGGFDVVVTDLVMDREDDGLKVLDAARQTQPQAETIMVTAHGDVPTAKAALRGGAYDFIEKPLDLDIFRNLVQRAAQTVLLRTQNAELRQQADESFGVEGIIGVSTPMHQAIATARQVAKSDIPVLITGDSGTGKELIASAIHQNSRRSRKNFKAFNCAAVSPSLIESELFGHVKGAFTGAERDREGIFEYADGGTLFLDEIGDMPIEMQAKLLRVLESGEVVRVGANAPRIVDVRFLAATNHDLKKLIEAGKFREDLYFRIRGAQVHLPPLRERREDIPILTHHFIQRFSKEMSKKVNGIDEEAQRELLQYHWPGNVRELINVVRNMVVIADDDESTLTARHVPIAVREALRTHDTAAGDVGSLAGLSLGQIEKHAIRNTLALCGNNREQAAKMLGIGERTLYRKLKEYGLK